MKVINPEAEIHEVEIIPRFSPVGEVQLILYNEATQENIILECEFTISDGIGNLVFVKNDFVKGQKYQFKLLNNDNVLYRGKMTVTDQEPQEYKLTKDFYRYE